MALKSWLKASPLFAFNQVNRDIWVAEQAASLPAGAKVLDMGAGSRPYRPLFANCRYETQDVFIQPGFLSNQTGPVLLRSMKRTECLELMAP